MIIYKILKKIKILNIVRSYRAVTKSWGETGHYIPHAMKRLHQIVCTMNFSSDTKPIGSDSCNPKHSEVVEEISQ